MRSLFTLMIVFCIFYTKAQKNIVSIEEIYKDKGVYYTVVESNVRPKQWFSLFIQFDSVAIINKGQACIVNNEYNSGVIKWQILHDTLFYLSVTKIFSPENSRPYANSYFQYPLDTVFKMLDLNTVIMNRAKKYSWSLPFHTYYKNKFEINAQHTWYDYVHTKNEFTIFASIADTILMVKDIPSTYASRKISDIEYHIREQFFTFHYLKKFNVFKLDSNYYLLNDLGDFYLLKDSVPKKIGYLKYQNIPQLFYLMDNDNNRLSFNCPYVSLYTEYENLVGFIDNKHWLTMRYFYIKEKYSIEAGKMSRLKFDK